MSKEVKKQEEKKSWEQPYKQGNTQEKEGQYNLFRLYKNMGVTRSIAKLKQYCENKDNQKELEEKKISYPRTRKNILPMEKQIQMG